MSNLLPIIDLLAGARSHRERAEWLLSCPIAILRRYDMTIRNRLMLAGSQGCLVYIEAMRAVMDSTRDAETGLFSPSATEIMRIAGERMLAWADDSDGVHEPNHDLTEL